MSPAYLADSRGNIDTLKLILEIHNKSNLDTMYHKTTLGDTHAINMDLHD
jgi:hypothetical protein